MRKAFLFFFISISFHKSALSQQDSAFTVHYFIPVPNTHIRALYVLGESTVWFAANRGVWGYTEDAGRSWHVDSIKVDTVYPQFRSISVLNDSTVLLFSIASPAYLLKTTNKGKTWKIVYKNTQKDIFFDSMIFYDPKDGIAVGDPINGCFQIIKTDDGGASWKQIDCANIPEAKQGETCFAASNTNIAASPKQVWFATGGMSSRIFHSVDNGNHFEVFNSPMPEGEKMTGVFSLSFFDEKNGIIGGGNYEKTDSSILSIAYTKDSGKIWNPVRTDKAFFCSCVQFSSSDVFWVTGQDGTYKCANNSGKVIEIKDKSNAALKFNTLRFSPSKKALWLAGDKGSIALINL